MRVSIDGVAVATVDLSAQGGDTFFPVASDVALDAASVLTVECPPGGGTCVADAVLVESAARWNDGADAANVTLQAFDAIVLERKGACGARALPNTK
jgi:hypothetical protein